MTEISDPVDRDTKPKSRLAWTGWLRGFSPEQILAINVVAAFSATLIAIYFEHELVTGPTTQLFIAAGLILIAVTAAVVYNRLVDPLNAMGEPCGGRQSLSEALGEVRLDFIADIVDVVKEDEEERKTRPVESGALAEEAFKDLNVLVNSALICKGLIQTAPRARELLGRYIVVLAAALPLLLGLAVFVEPLNQNYFTGAGAFVTTLAVGGYLLLFVSFGGPSGLSRWRERVIELRRLPFAELKRMVKGWGEEEAADD